MKYLIIISSFLVACGSVVEQPIGDAGKVDSGAESGSDSALLVCRVIPATMFCETGCGNQCYNGSELTCDNGTWKPTGNTCTDPCYCSQDGYYCNGQLQPNADSCANCGLKCDNK